MLKPFSSFKYLDRKLYISNTRNRLQSFSEQTIFSLLFKLEQHAFGIIHNVDNKYCNISILQSSGIWVSAKLLHLMHYTYQFNCRHKDGFISFSNQAEM